ncbi:MAG: electron transfer flavoprotein-ubiquinone oxidoreductase [Legionellales bacterium]|nr:electron transfer flavoprotein-ubiquinone oxidoreductase [Legionellales bacterium]
MQRESIPFDVVIVGAGPAGLSAAIRLKQLANAANSELSVCVLDKAANVGGHILSGAVLEPRALAELFPNWQDLDAPLDTPVTSDEFLLLSANKATRLPTPKPMCNQGNFIISLAKLCRWLSEQAQQLGVEIFPGFAATEVLYDDNGGVIGVATGDMGIDKHGQHTERYQPGIELHAKQTLFAEGCRGSLTKILVEKFNLARNAEPQTYGLGIKEVWEVNNEHYQPGKVIHTIGWPLDNHTYGGSFIYQMNDNKVAVGFVVGLDYQNPYLSPFQEMQRFKTHPHIKPLFEGAKRIAYGARALNEGGFQSIPELSFPGGLLIGCSAGFLNVPKIKGNHTAMKSGMVAAETVFSAIKKNELTTPLLYKAALKKSWVWPELKRVRNVRPAFRWGLWLGLIYSAIDTYIFRGRAPWTFKNHPDNKSLKPAKDCQKIDYPKPDGVLTFDRLSSVYLTNTFHEENQPCHLQLGDPKRAIDINYEVFASPESYYCPAAVYEIQLDDKQQPYLQINAQNCIHCKTCDIKDPTQNINWVPPEGGGGPNYEEL